MTRLIYVVLLYLYVMVKRYLEPCWIGWYLWASHQLNEPLIINMYPKLV